jgi:hypothetical protein
VLHFYLMCIVQYFVCVCVISYDKFIQLMMCVCVINHTYFHCVGIPLHFCRVFYV